MTRFGIARTWEVNIDRVKNITIVLKNSCNVNIKLTLNLLNPLACFWLEKIKTDDKEKSALKFLNIYLKTHLLLYTVLIFFSILKEKLSEIELLSHGIKEKEMKVCELQEEVNNLNEGLKQSRANIEDISR